MDKYIYHRMIGAILTLSTVSVYLLSCLMAMSKELPTHPELKIFDDLGPRYNTVWGMVFLIMYLIMALMCDISVIRNREHDVPPHIRSFRFKIFHEVVFPQVSGIIAFWPVFFYDRELVFPKVVDIIISPVGNFVFHGLGIVYVLWELVFLPRDVPKRSDVKRTKLLGLNTIFTIVLLYTKYVDLGVWMYEVLTATEGTILFPIIFFGIAIMSNIAYSAQWYVKDYVWSLRSTCKDD
ncbi:hypothetical protein ABMA27_010918 [Loxostege sticticalis]|uniref:Androgen-dependent TFPI-regulating protein n=1 Tax=Loxostege sticticalis TaxID=481309 RepID=A0ABR3H2M8_LOXSC